MKLPINYETATPKQRKAARDEYIRLQRGYCYHCGALLTGKPDPQVREYRVTESLFPVGFFNWPVHLHHNHKTGMTIGAVHNYCNAVLWEYFQE